MYMYMYMYMYIYKYIYKYKYKYIYISTHICKAAGTGALCWKGDMNLQLSSA